MEDFKDILVTSGDKCVNVLKNPTSYELLGKGIQGAVFKLSENRCVKIYSKEEYATSEQEVLMAAKGSEFFPEIYESGKNYTVMEYIHGVSLYEHFQNSGQMTKSLTKQLLDMLKERIQLGFPRCDANLRHIIINNDKKIKVIDHVNTYKKKRITPRSMFVGLEKLGMLRVFLENVKEIDEELYLKWKKSKVLGRYVNAIECIQKLENYEIQEVVGKGIQGTVYKGYDRLNERIVAIKKRVNIKGAEREVAIMKKYGDHPFLPKLYDYFIAKNRAFIVMEFVNGKPLGLCNKVDKLNETEAIQITLNVLRGLYHLHKHGILHCDILPKNILITEDSTGSIKIIDFGFSLEKGKYGVYKGKRKHRRVVRKPPELRESFLRLDDSTDLYETAYLCVSLLKGSFPKWDEQKQIHTFDLCNQKLKKVIQKAMNKNIRRRYSSTRQFMRALKQVLKKE